MRAVKTHPHLLVRDALAALFVRAADGDSDAFEGVRALAAWARGEAADRAALAPLRAEDGDALFDGDALAPRFAALSDSVRDRAARLEAACRWIEGEALAGDPVECARCAWDAGLFFEVHELVEPAWLAEKGERRTGLQGLIMAGAGLHHLVEGNLAGAGSLLRDAARHLEQAPRDARYDLESFAKGLTALGDRIKRGEVRGVADVGELPRLETRED